MHIPRLRILCGLGCVAFVALSGVLQAQSDVTQPGDPVIASSSNMPGSEGVANVIDNTDAKYLNFDTRTPDNTPSGFIVTPSVGVTRVVGMTIKTANDAPERDPKTVTLEGSNDATVTTWTGGNWEMITTVDFPATTVRFATQTAMFTNFKPYKHYRWTAAAVQTPNGCCMQVAEVELLGSTLPSDVTTPGDDLVASSANMPGSEGVANAIDNTDAKYLNFDTRTPDNTPSGFIVTPSIGKTVVTGMTVRTANDAPERDPKTVTLEGSNDATVAGWTGGNWEMITTLEFPATTVRFETQTILFDNYKPFAHYRWTVAAVQTPNGCCMQVAEVELLGTSAPKDVTQPGDPVIASSANMPGSEGVANAIDNTDAKYLNFDTRTPDNTPSGFIVTPSVGATAVTGMTIKTANDAPERDPKTVTLEGSNDDTVTTWTGGNWEMVATVEFPATTVRFETQEAYFPNAKAFKHYRWTVAAVQTPNGCCMQVAEVELLAATASNPCEQTQFVLAPVDTPVLNGAEATFIVSLNGPWTIQWLKNDIAIPGATELTYTTEAITPANQTNLYACAIVGCQTSQVVRASVFTPSSTKSIGINFIGGGANGSPTSMNPTNATGVVQYDVAGVQLQAYWNNATNRTGDAGDGAAMGPLVDSDNAESTMTFSFATEGTWGAGTETLSGTGRMLNGYAGSRNTTDIPSTFTFGNVPAGNHSLLVYMVNAPLQFQKVSLLVEGAANQTYYIRPMNSDEYKPAPGFYRGSSTDPNAPSVANFIRFDNVQPLGGAGGTIVLTMTPLTSYDREVGVNGLQLVLNAPNVGAPPAITTQPLPTVAAAGATAQLSVAASGNDLTYQWRKNGRNLPNGGNVSGVTTPNLVISNVSTNDVAVYNVAVFNAAGSVVSKNASLRLSKYDIADALVGHWKLDETGGLVAANAISGGQPGNVTGAASWAAGRIANAFSFDSATYMLVNDYPKATEAIAGSAWVKLDPSTAGDMAIFRNGHSDFNATGGDLKVLGQFELGIIYDTAGGALWPTAAIGIAPNVARATASTGLSVNAWHHLAFSGDGAQLRLYVDGQQVASSDYLGKINPAMMDWISIGARLVVDTNTPPAVPDPTTPAYMFGQVDDIGLWTRGLAPDEVTGIYQAGQQGKALDTVVVTPPVTEPPKISGISQAGGNVTVTWTGGGTLYSSPSLSAPNWTTTADSDGSFTAPLGTGNLFFRVQR
jgi:hypothetical protein